MTKWVTFYYSILDGLKDIVVHPNREDAEKYFLENYKKYFNLKTPLKNFKLPYKYGFGHRAYHVIIQNAWSNTLWQTHTDDLRLVIQFARQYGCENIKELKKELCDVKR